MCDLETSRMRRPWPTGSCGAKRERKKQILDFHQWETFLAYQREYIALKSVFFSYGGRIKECSN
jgi:hypothetical protein